MVVSIIICGAGDRGKVYAKYAKIFPDKCRVVGVADPIAFRRETVAREYELPAENVFETWEEMAKRPKFADAVVVATQDAFHRAPAVAFAALGYHLLVEKPMAITEQDCRDIVEAVERAEVMLAVGHVMRYSDYSQTIKSVISSGVLGDIVNIQHVEPVGFFHAAHSYVRGNWARSDRAAFKLMAKCCHDVDWLLYMLGDRCTKISSFGTLKHFNKTSKPAEAGDATRCLTCDFERKCPYSAKRIYIDNGIMGGDLHWCQKIVNAVPDIENITEALATGPYGRCVYESDNDVVDNQVVSMQFASGASATLTMIDFSADLCQRKSRIYGTKGELICDERDKSVVFTDFLTMERREIPVVAKDWASGMGGHGGADGCLMAAFVEAIASNDPTRILSGPRETLASHLVVFAAERARLESCVVDVPGFSDAN